MDTREESYFERFSRNIGILNREEQGRLMHSCVAIAGTGGVGGIIAERLARCGIGRLRIADPEAFQTTDINRQVGSSMSSLGKKKVSVLESTLLDINPDLELSAWDHSVDDGNADSFVDGADLVVNEIDGNSLSCILALCRAARRRGVRVIQGAVRDLSAGIFVFTPEGTSPDFFLNILCPIYSNGTGAPLSTVAPACSLAGSFVSSEAVLTLLGRPSMPAVPEFTMVYLNPPGTRVIDLSGAAEEWMTICNDFYTHNRLSKSKVDRLRADLRTLIEKPVVDGGRCNNARSDCGKGVGQGLDG